MSVIKVSALVVIVIGAFLAGVWYEERDKGSSSPAASSTKIIRYNCPMHPAYISERPGDCPSCGMRLVPLNADEEGHAHPTKNMEGEMANAVHISLQKQQLIGVRLAKVEKASGMGTLRAVGRVAPDETRTYVINATVDGWITSTMPNSTGSFVRKNEVLATFYSPEFLSATQALIFALTSMDRVQNTGKENPAQKDQLAQFQINLRQYKDSLRNLGMGDLQVQRLIDKRQYTERVDITSPADGFILARRVSNGLRFNKGDEMYRIADLSRVWILVDIFENEERYLQPGAHLTINLPNQGATVNARVTNILPQFDPNTRTLKVRLEAENPGFRLRPEMFADIELPVHYRPSITVPSVAVLDTGRSKTVFVALGNGHFEPRHVETGWRMGDRVEVTKGLMEGEQIVVSGNFLIDSESRLRAAAMNLPQNTILDPICGMDVDPAKAGGMKIVYNGRTFYFCSEICKNKFQRDPARYAAKLGSAIPIDYN